MAIRSGFFNSVNGDRKYDAKRFAEYFASFIGNGVFPDPSDGLQVVANDDMTVTVKAGKCWINGYIMINDDDYILEIEPADGVLNRIDRIVARYDVVDREIRLEIKKGQFASNPVAQNLQRDADAYELGLADITVIAGSISISQANITDLRLDNNYCGIVEAIVKESGDKIPRGSIIMWSGKISEIPEGWALCDGTNGTPNLKDRFIMGAVTDAAINKTGGANAVSLTVAQMPSHSHSGSVASAGSHTHSFNYPVWGDTSDEGTGSGYAGRIISTGSRYEQRILSAGAHTHSVSIGSTGSGEPHENRPAYYTLAFIMKL